MKNRKTLTGMYRFACTALAASALAAGSADAATIQITVVADDAVLNLDGGPTQTTVRVFAQVLDPADANDGIFSYGLNLDRDSDAVAFDAPTVDQPNTNAPSSPGTPNGNALQKITGLFDNLYPGSSVAPAPIGVGQPFELMSLTVTAVSEGQATITVTPDQSTGADFLLFSSTLAESVDYSGASTTIQVVPEPASLSLLALGGVLIARRRRG